MNSVFINKFQIIRPKYFLPQADLLKWIIRAHQQTESFNKNEDSMSSDRIEKLFHKYGVKESQISQRYFECNDVFLESWKNAAIYQLEQAHPNGADLLKRSQFFSDRALEVFKEIYAGPSSDSRPDHLVHVTCTGYVSPSAAQRIVTEDFWRKHTEITHAYHMGCYAALPAIRIAKSLVTSEKIQVDIIHNEMCGLHMDTSAQTPEQMVVQTLFADGHAKYSLSEAQDQPGKNLKLLGIHEKVIPNSQMDMSWIPGSFGMQMNLSRHVPEKIKLELHQFSDELFSKARIPKEDTAKSIFAVHPGGPKIIDAVQEVLSLKEEQISESRKILFERGNMSSATLPHVWNEILQKNYPLGTRIVSYAFGQGLTLFGSVFEVC